MKRAIQAVVAAILLMGVGYLILFISGSINATVEIAGKTIKVEVADEPAERELGLSGRDGLAQNSGMLFIFEHPARHGIWMKDMKFPIDIIWMNENKVIVEVEKDVSPQTYPKAFLPNRPALYVLEVPAGYISQNEIQVGDSAKISTN